MVSRMIERVQRKMEARNFEIRKNLLEYDQVMDEQRKLVYTRRQAILEGRDLKETMLDHVEDAVRDLVDRHAAGDRPDEWDVAGLARAYRAKFEIDPKPLTLEAAGSKGDLDEKLVTAARRRYDEREARIGADDMRRLERFLLLNAYDTKWKDHLYAMDGLKSGIGLRGYGQVDPKQEYKREGYTMFEQMLELVRDEVTNFIFRVRVTDEAEAQLQSRWDARSFDHAEFDAFGAHGRGPDGSEGGAAAGPIEPIKRDQPKVGRNDPCPCGSGRKYKKCHGAA
jgi:preprotein translocase subunit SecA